MQEWMLARSVLILAEGMKVLYAACSRQPASTMCLPDLAFQDKVRRRRTSLSRGECTS